MKKISASVSPVSFLSGSRPVVTLYLSGFPAIAIWWCVTTGSCEVVESFFAASADGLVLGLADSAANTGAAVSHTAHNQKIRRIVRCLRGMAQRSGFHLTESYRSGRAGRGRNGYHARPRPATATWLHGEHRTRRLAEYLRGPVNTAPE